MKKLFAIALFSVLVSGLSAQVPIRYGDPNYWFVPYGNVVTGGVAYGSAFTSLYVPDSTTPVLGIAVTASDMVCSDSNFHYNAVLYEKLNPYDDTNPGFWLTECMPRTFNERHRSFEYCGSDDTVIAMVEEFYFDHIHYMSDTFVVGVADFRYNDGYLFPDGYNWGLVQIWRHQYADWDSARYWAMRSVVQQNPHNSHITCEGFHLVDSHSDQDSCHRLVQIYDNWGGIFPIIGFRCDSVVTGLRSYPSQGRVLWNDNGTEMYKVAVGYGNKPVDSAFWVFTTTDSVLYLDTLEHGVSLGVWVRSMCRYTTSTYDTVVWGPWSSKAILYMPLADIDVVEPGVDFVLSPNPAAGTVKISCDEPVLNVEMLNVAGRRVLSCKGPLPADGLIDLCQLPSGLYTVHVTTPSGIGIQRLVVE